MFRFPGDIFRYRELLLLLVVRNLKIRYKNSALGFFWSLLAPLFLIVIYYVFLSIMKFGMPLSWLVVGIIIWQFLATCLGDSLHAVVGNAQLVKRTAFPRIVLPLAMVTSNLVNFLLSCAVLGVFLVAVGTEFGAVYWLPLIVLTQCALCLGMALIVATANVFYRDTEHLISIVMLAWFFMSPVIYSFDMVWERWPGIAAYAAINPMVGIIGAYRAVLLNAQTMPAEIMTVSFAVSWLILTIGVIVFQAWQPHFAEEL